MKKRFGFIPVFAASMTGAILAMLYTILVVKDSRELRPREVLEEQENKPRKEEKDGEKTFLQGFFDVENVKYVSQDERRRK